SYSQRGTREHYSDRGAPNLGAAGRVDSKIVQPFAAGARSDAGLVDAVYHRLDRYARDRLSRSGLGAAADDGFRGPVSLSGGDHLDHLLGDSRHISAAGLVTCPCDPCDKITGRWEFGT